MSDVPKPGFVRFKTWEEMTPREREFYDPHRRDELPMCQGVDYDPFAKYDRETYDRDD